MHKTINEGQVGLFWKRGKIVRELPAGRHRYWFVAGQRIDIIDVRTTQFSTVSEEYATKDNLTVRCSLTISWSVKNATTMVRTTADPNALISTKVINELRTQINKLTLDGLLEKISKVHEVVVETATKELLKAGIKLDDLSPLNLLIPRSLKLAFEAEVAARKRAVADMEEARGRTAVLRHLANSASMVEQHPALLQLLIGQKAKNVQFQFNANELKEKSAK